MIVVEWTINNFSFWNEYVHEKQMECLKTCFGYCPTILLYPRGLSGHGDHLVVHIYAFPAVGSTVLSGHLSCIDSSGSVICTQDIDEKVRRGDFYELLTMLKFDDVAAQIRKNETLHQDQFTLRCELKWKNDRAYRFYTAIDVFDSSVEIDLKILHKCKSRFLLSLQYPYDDSEKKVMNLSVTRKNTIFSIHPDIFLNNILVITSMSVLNFNSVTRTEENEHVFQDCTEWTFFNSLTEEESNKEGLTLLLRVKIIPGNKFRHHYGYYTGNSKAVYALPTDIFTHKTSEVAPSNKPDSSVTVLLNQLVCLYQDHEFSDFQLRCGQVSFPTHKSILAARSPVFKAMLLSGLKESASDSMDVVDLDISTLGRFLLFLYTGTVDDLEWEVALKLYYAADKYQVPTLKRECLSVFRKQVSISNVCDILSLADRHQNEELSTEAQDFILQNYNEVLRSEGWRTFLMNEPLLAVKTVTYFAEKNEFKVISNS